MATIIPNITFKELRQLKYDQLKQLKSCAVYADSEHTDYLFTFVNPQTDFVRLQVENVCQLGNAVGGKRLEELLEAVK